MIDDGSEAQRVEQHHEPPEPEERTAAAGSGAPVTDAAVTAGLETQLLRALADLDNLRRRFEREVARERALERARSTALWLPVVDDLERALQHAAVDAPSIVEGVRSVRDQAVGVLDGLGFERFEDVGERFDPERHEALTAVDADAPAGTIVATVRPGYGSDGTILRPAGVVVAKGAG